MQNFESMINETRLIAIIRGIGSEHLAPVLDAIYAGGVRLAEITYDSTGVRSDEETARWIAEAAERMEGKMYIGAGTVLKDRQVELTEHAGGSFIISPNMDREVIRKTKALGMFSIPAAMTVSEIVEADRAGADYIKVFPADAIGGAAFFRAVRAPLPGIRLLAVSGVTPENAGEYLRAGAYGFGIGSGIVNAALCKAENYRQIEENARRFSDACAGK